MRFCTRALGPCVLILAVFAGPALLQAAKHARRPAKAKSEPAGRTVELFQAIDDGLVEVKFIPKNSRQARIFVANVAGEPLNIEMPRAFGAVPVLAQNFQGGQGFGQGLNGIGNGLGQGQGQGQGQGSGQGAQNMGGGMGNGQNGGNQNGMFNIAAEKTKELKVACVCLEHGKADPRPAIPYRLVPLSEVTSDQAIETLLAGLADDRFEQRPAQAAAWHLASGMSWQELTDKKIEHLVDADEPYFTKKELKAARSIVTESLSARKTGSTETAQRN